MPLIPAKAGTMLTQPPVHRLLWMSLGELFMEKPAGGRLRRNLGSFEVLLLTLSCLSPVVSIFGMGGDVLHQVGTGAAGLFGLGIGAAW